MKNVRMKMIGAAMFCLLFIIGCGGGGGDSQTVIAEAKLRVSPTSHNFDGVVLNNSADQLFTINNSGNYRALIKFSSTDAQFFVTETGDCPEYLEAGKSCSFIARFKPNKQGLQTGTISIASDNPAPVSLQGFGHGLNAWINQIVNAACGVGGVEFDITVTGAAGALGVSNFTLTQNGVVQTTNVTVSLPITPDPVSVVLALDLSKSLTSAIGDIRTAAKYFVSQLDVDDEAAIYKFKASIASYPTSGFITTDSTGKDALEAAIDNDLTLPDPSSEGTALYDAVYNSLTRAAAGSKSKRAVIVLSDGANESGIITLLADLRAHPQYGDIPIFTIHYVDPDYASKAKPEIMKQLADETGGQDFYANAATLQVIYGQIATLLNNRYRITYTPTPSPTACTGSQLLRVDVRDILPSVFTGFDTKTIGF